jgi:hypothetical protein
MLAALHADNPRDDRFRQSRSPDPGMLAALHAWSA